MKTTDIRRAYPIRDYQAGARERARQIRLAAATEDATRLVAEHRREATLDAREARAFVQREEKAIRLVAGALIEWYVIPDEAVEVLLEYAHRRIDLAAAAHGLYGLGLLDEGELPGWLAERHE